MSLPLSLSAGARVVCSCAFALTAVSCATDESDPFAGDNAFLQSGAPRYGAGGTMSPSQNPGRYRVGEPIPPSEYGRSRRGTVFLDERSSNPQESTAARGRNTVEGGAPVQQPTPDDDESGRSEAKPKPRSTETDPNSVIESPKPEIQQETKPEPETSSKPEPAPTSDKPVATPVPGQAGMVYSPFDPEKRKVNVEGFPSGSEARCPYTKKVFRVP